MLLGEQQQQQPHQRTVRSAPSTNGRITSPLFICSMMISNPLPHAVYCAPHRTQPHADRNGIICCSTLRWAMRPAAALMTSVKSLFICGRPVPLKHFIWSGCMQRSTVFGSTPRELVFFLLQILSSLRKDQQVSR